MSATTHPVATAYFHRPTFSVQYVVACAQSGACAIIDPVLDYDERSGSIDTQSADAIFDHIRRDGLSIEWILDTHPHADHFSAADYLRQRTGAPIGIGDRIVDVQRLWKELYNLPSNFPCDGSQWDRLFRDGDRFSIGNVSVEVLLCPGHTLASVTYLAGDAAFIHDTLFMPDFGTARADFPGGDARALWTSIQRIVALPDNTRLFTGHDYMPGGREPAWESTVAVQRETNCHLRQSPTEQAFISLRQQRDATLPLPKLMLHALQVNIRGGCLPESEENGRSYLKLPLMAFPNAVWA